MGLLLFIIAWFLKWCFSPVLLVWGFIRRSMHGWNSETGWKRFVGAYNYLSDWFNEMADANDQFGNVLGMDTWNDFLAKDTEEKKKYSAGDRQVTISYFLGRNQYRGTQPRLGQKITRALNLLESDHAHKALLNNDARFRKKVFELETPN